MNKYLLAGAAAAALVVGAGVVNAQDFKITLSGEARFQAMFVGQDKDANSRSVDFRNRFRLNINPEATGLNGMLTYGAHTKFRAEGAANNTVDFEEARVYFKGAFGEVQFGSTGSWYDGNNTKRPADWQPEDGITNDLVGASRDAAWTNGYLKAGQFMDFNAGDKRSTVRYDSPFIMGFAFGASYTPNRNGYAWSVDRQKTGYTDIFDVGMRFDSTDKSVADRFGGAKVKASVGYGSAANQTANSEDLSVVAMGIQVGYAGFTLGGGYASEGKSGLSKADTTKVSHRGWNIGAQYETGALTVGLGYTDTQWDDSDATRTGKLTGKTFTVGAKYAVAKGLTVAAEYGHVNSKNTARNISDTANTVILTTTVEF